jgi:protein TonB
MLATLLESKARRERSTGQLLVSVAAHTAIIGAALYATATAGSRPASSAVDLRLVYAGVPPRRSLAPAAATPRKSTAPSPSSSWSLITRTIPIDVSGIKTSVPTFDPSAIAGTALAGLPLGNSVGDPVPVVYAGEAMRAEQVEKPAALAPGNSPPRYPEALRASGVEGQVIASFIISAEGRYEEGSLRFVKSGNPLFERAVQAALPRMRFVPAEIAGRPVRQLVEMPFVFTLQR